MGMFGAKEGMAWTRSESDPRWNMSVHCFCGGFVMPEELEELIEEKKKELGDELPKDLEWAYMKD